MSDTYKINESNQVVRYTSGRKCTDTRAWRDATDLEMQQQEQIEQLERELIEARKEREQWADECDKNAALLKEAVELGELAIRQRDTLESALRSLMDEHDDFAAQYNQVKETDVYGSDSEAMEKAKQAIKLVAKGGSDE